ncbi:Beta-mannanase/endoglucanase A [Leucoagaricus sp. SymC.cos]|nr:Beta-mannanase/endoglucanase A [Leucoagaricus sp. SymC.cos]
MRFGSTFIKLVVFVLAVAISKVSGADLNVYTDDALASGWENWSWSSTINFAATDLISGSSGSSISVTSDAWAALSLYYRPETFKTYAGLKFDIAGDQPDISIQIQSVADSVNGPNIPLSAISNSITSSGFTSVLIDFTNLPGTGAALPDANWDRISIQAGGNGATYHVDNIVLVESIVVTPEFLSAEPLASNVIAVTTKGDVDVTAVKVALNGSPVTISNHTTYVPVDTPALSITYFTLAKNFAAGTLTITAGESSFNHTLPNVLYGSIVQSVAQPINPHIYGVNFPTSASYIKNLGVTISRWGGNAVTAYNPFGGFTNAGNDWYFENRNPDDGSADDWIGWVHGAGSDSLVTIPALDWVSKDNVSYSYPKTIYPDQAKFDPYNADAGNGQFANGSWVFPPDPTRVYTAWNITLAKRWLTGLTNKPKIVTIDNEIEIASSTHQDMHPEPIDYDEELDRVVRFATTAKQALPGVLVAAPSTCSWWFYWTSEVGWSDTAAHDNVDFLPWFLAQMKKAEASAGKRLLDYLDIHYYYQADTSANDDAAKALRLRMTRSLWDKSYVDESWVGVDPQNHQWDPDHVELIPRMKTLIDINYPGTKLSISEWSSTKDDDITGGLVTVESLGLFGKYGVDAATYWATPGEQAPVGLAYWLYRGYGTYFGSKTAQVNLANPDPNTWNVFAGSDGSKLTLVIVNKNPSQVLSFDLSNVPTGKYFVRHFGGAAGVAKWQTTLNVTTGQFIVVPGYTAVFLKQQ